MRQQRTLRRVVASGLGLATLASAALVTAAPPAAAAPAPVTVSQVQPASAGNANVIVVNRVAAENSSAADRWRMNLDMVVRNNQSSSVTLDRLDIAYPGSAITTKVTYPSTYFKAGQSRRVIVPEYRLHPYPIAGSAQVTLRFKGYDPLVVTRSLSEYQATTPSGGMRVPFLASELGKNSYWYTTVTHNPSDHHRPVIDQRFAYDLDRRVWDGSTWNHIVPGSSENTLTNHYAYNMPVYAMADGIIRRCDRSRADTPMPKKSDVTPVQGNHVYIEHGAGQVALYAHFKPGSLPSALCPNNTPNIAVRQGQFLGRVGNSGNSSRPHLHLHMQSSLDVNDPQNAQGIPINFDHTKVRLATGYNPGGSPGFTNVTVHREAGIPTDYLISPNACGFDPITKGQTQWVRHGVSSACFQESFDDLTQHGYRPIAITPFEVAGAQYFNSIWRPRAGKGSYGYINQTASSYQSTFDNMTGAGYRLTHVDSYLLGGQARYASVFTKESGPAWAAYHGVSGADHQTRFNDLVKKGYRPVVISVASPGNVPQYTALYHQVDVGSFVALSNINDADYQTRMNEQVNAGRKLTYVDVYRENGVNKFSAIWTSAASSNWAARHGLTGSGFQSAFNENTAAGRLTVAISGYDGGGARYAGLWRA